MNKSEILFGLIVAILLAILLSPFASSSPDGLERVAEDKGFLEAAEEVKTPISAPLPDYLWPGIKNEALATSLAGLIGALIVFGLSYGLAIAFRKSA